jgi:hypothetical protein
VQPSAFFRGSIFSNNLVPLPPFALLVAYAKCSQQFCAGLKINFMKKSEKHFVPYHVNPAVIKGHLNQLPKEQLALHGRYIRVRAGKEAPGSNRRAMFVGLYQFCRCIYIEKFK